MEWVVTVSVVEIRGYLATLSWWDYVMLWYVMAVVFISTLVRNQVPTGLYCNRPAPRPLHQWTELAYLNIASHMQLISFVNYKFLLDLESRLLTLTIH